MARLIDADALQIKIDSLSRLAQADAQKLLLGRVFYIIDHMPAIPAYQWISVEDRLPEEQKEVLIYLPEYDSVEMASLFTIPSMNLREWVQNEDACMLDEVSHWMPLPEPPEEVRDVKNLMENKKILDVTCGGRTIWFDKHHPAAVYCDIRHESYTSIWGWSERKCEIAPDIRADFTNLPFKENSFYLVVFDPPHLKRASQTSWLVKKYGILDENWPQMLHDGFRECMRVLKPNGVLIFKWSETQIPAGAVWKAIGQRPLFGHHSGKKSKTFWACFMKGE